MLACLRQPTQSDALPRTFEQDSLTTFPPVDCTFTHTHVHTHAVPLQQMLSAYQPSLLQVVGSACHTVCAFCFWCLKIRHNCHLFPTASFAPISFAIKAKENDLLPLEKNRVKLDDDSEEDEESRECQESTSSVANPSPAAAPPSVVVEEKKPQLTQEELEAKQGLSIAFKVLERKKTNIRFMC